MIFLNLYFITFLILLLNIVFEFQASLPNMTTRVYIGHLSSRATERDVEDFFRGFGKIRDVILKSGFGFVVS